LIDECSQHLGNGMSTEWWATNNLEASDSSLGGVLTLSEDSHGSDHKLQQGTPEMQVQSLAVWASHSLLQEFQQELTVTLDIFQNSLFAVTSAAPPMDVLSLASSKRETVSRKKKQKLMNSIWASCELSHVLDWHEPALKWLRSCWSELHSSISVGLETGSGDKRKRHCHYAFTLCSLCVLSLNIRTLCKIWGFHSRDYEEYRLLRYKNSVLASQETYYFSAKKPSRLILRKILGFHSGDYEDRRFLGCYAVWLL
jgi:hypothetical protein